MKDIVFLGNSSACVDAIEEIRKYDQDSRITLISRNHDLPFSRHLFSSWVDRELNETDVILKKQEFYDNYHVQVLFDKRIVKVDLKRNRLVSEEKENFRFDILVIADMQVFRFPDIKGIQKKGVFHLKSMESIKDILALLPLVETVAIQGDSIQSLLMACSLKKRGKEVFLFLPTRKLIPRMFEEEASHFLVDQLGLKGLRVFQETVISEILGESDVKAVRLSNGKVMACQSVIFDQVTPDLRILQNSSLEINNNKVKVDKSFRSNIENVFALDSIGEQEGSLGRDDFEVSFFYLREQGRILGGAICGETLSFSVPFHSVSFNLMGIPVAVLGKTKPGFVRKEYIETDGPKGLFKKIFIEDNVVCGAILINQADNQEIVSHLIEEKKDISVLGFRDFETSSQRPAMMDVATLPCVEQTASELNVEMPDSSSLANDQTGRQDVINS